MASKLYSVLLIESDATIISDVGTALRLVNIPLIVAKNFEDARRLLTEVKPSLLLVRAGLSIGGESGIQFVRASRSAPGGSVCALLVTQPELASYESDIVNCRGAIEFPVQFPAFTYRVQEMLAADSSPQASKEGSRVSPREHAAEPVTAPSDEKLAQLLLILHRIGESVTRNPHFLSCDSSALPRIVSEAAHVVCVSFNAPPRR